MWGIYRGVFLSGPRSKSCAGLAPTVVRTETPPHRADLLSRISRRRKPPLQREGRRPPNILGAARVHPRASPILGRRPRRQRPEAPRFAPVFFAKEVCGALSVFEVHCSTLQTILRPRVPGLGRVF